MNALIIDDEPDARQALRMLLAAHFPEVAICGEAATAAQAAALIASTRPDVVFLDIDLGKGSGFEVLDAFPSPDFQVIFITAHNDFAVKAFRYNALDYLLKPLNPDELSAAVCRLSDQLRRASYSDRLHNLRDNYRTQHLDRLAFPSIQGHLFVQVSEIVHLEADGNYCHLSLSNGERHFAARSIKDFEDLLPPDDFVRCHQSHIVQVSKIRRADKAEGLTLHMINGARVPVSRRKQGEVQEMLGV